MKWLPSLTKRDKSPDEPDRCVRAEPQFVKQAASCYPEAIPYLSPFMRGSSIAILVTVFLALLVAVSDYYLKHASTASHPFLNRNFVIGLIITALCSFGWVLVMPHLKLAYIGVIYSLTVVLSLCLVGTVFFGETLKVSEWVGVGLAVTSLLLLYRVA